MAEPSTEPGFLVIDTESVPDGKLLGQVKYPADGLAPHDAILRAQAEARELSPVGSDFLPVTFQIPVAACVLRLAGDYTFQNLCCLDTPLFRPRKIVEDFWSGITSYRSKFQDRVRLVTFNGRGFDLPLLELAAFRFGVSCREHFANGRKRFDGWHLDIMDWLTNYGAYRMSGGLNLLSKILGKPGKMDIQGDKVYQLFCEGKLQEINDYCMFDTLDTFFVFLRTRVLTGEITLEREQQLVQHARDWLTGQIGTLPALRQYLDNWGDWQPWPC